MKKAYEVIVIENYEGFLGPSDYLHGFYNAKFFELKKDAEDYVEKHNGPFSKTILKEIEIL